MGLLFVFAIHILIIYLLSLAIGNIGTGLSNFFSKKVGTKKRIVISAIGPFVGLTSFYFCAIVGATIVSNKKGVDIGIGDSWYIPISNHCSLQFTDQLEQGDVVCDKETAIPGVSQIQQLRDSIYGKTSEGVYFLFNTANKTLEEFPSESDFKKVTIQDKVVLQEVEIFYFDHKHKIAGNAMIWVGIISLSIGLLAIYIVRQRTVKTIYRA